MCHLSSRLPARRPSGGPEPSSPRACAGRSLRRLLLALALASGLAPGLAWSPGASATGALFGEVNDAACRPLPILESGGEAYFVLLDTGGGHSDWMVQASAKEGPVLGFFPGDFFGAAYAASLYGFRGEGWTPEQTLFALLTFPDGRIQIDSDRTTGGWVWFGNNAARPFGSSQAQGRGFSSIRLPEQGHYSARLGAGEVEFPRLVAGAPEIAFAPLREIDPQLDRSDCWGGYLRLDPSTGRGLVIGYNVYRVEDRVDDRVEDRGARPSPAELGAPASFLDFVPVHPGLPASPIGSLVDPDGWPLSQDEVLLVRDAAQGPDGEPRRRGSPPDLAGGRSYWYAIQPVIAGALDEFSAWSERRHDPADLRDDLDGNGLVDGVDFDGPGSANGPEFFSPQAELGLPGLGLTNGGLPLLSPAVRVGPCLVGIEAESLRFYGEALYWHRGPGNWGYRVRRARDPAALRAGDSEAPGLVEWTVERLPDWDEERPGVGGVFFYLVEPECGVE